MQRAQALIAFFFVVNLIAIGVWDVYCLVSANADSTVSSQLRMWSRASPILPLVAGLLIGHIFLCTCSPSEIKQMQDIHEAQNGTTTKPTH